MDSTREGWGLGGIKVKGAGRGGDRGRGSGVVTEENGSGRRGAEDGPETVNNI